MASELIAYPFRLAADGSVLTQTEGSDEYNKGQLLVLVLTEPFERELVPEFGMADPSFNRFDSAAVQAQVDLFGPPVNVRRVSNRFANDTTANVVIEFD